MPKVIHQTFPGRPPAVIQDNIDKLRRLNPGWEYRLSTTPTSMST